MRKSFSSTFFSFFNIFQEPKVSLGNEMLILFLVKEGIKMLKVIESRIYKKKIAVENDSYPY